MGSGCHNVLWLLGNGDLLHTPVWDVPPLRSLSATTRLLSLFPLLLLVLRLLLWWPPIFWHFPDSFSQVAASQEDFVFSFSRKRGGTATNRFQTRVKKERLANDMLMLMRQTLTSCVVVAALPTGTLTTWAKNITSSLHERGALNDNLNFYSHAGVLQPQVFIPAEPGSRVVFSPLIPPPGLGSGV